MTNRKPRSPIGRLPGPGAEDKFDLSRPLALGGPVGRSDLNGRTDIAKTETLLALAGALDINQTDGPTGYMGERLLQSIKSFQKDCGLSVDGRLNPDGETIKALAQNLQSLGRQGDTILAHITPIEAQLLHDITDGGTINPVTGLPEFFFGEMFSGLSDSLSSMGSSFANGLSDFGDTLSGWSDSFTSGLDDFGDSLSDGFSDIFGLGDGGGNTGQGLSKGLDAPLKRANLLEIRDGAHARSVTEPERPQEADHGHFSSLLLIKLL